MIGPSKKVAPVLIAVVIIVTGTIIFQNVKGDFFIKDKKSIPEKNLEIQITNAADKTNDTDDDGLTDWEESLWKTDKNNPDTDNDGTNDGEEVSLNRDPKKPAPDDELINLQDVYLKYTGDENDPNSLTTSIAKNIFTNIATANQDGQITNAEAKQLAESITNQANNQINLPEKFNSNQLITFDSSDKVKLKNYANLFVSTQTDELQRGLKDQGDNKEYLEKIVSIYESMSQKLFLLQTPVELANVHTQIANNLFKISIILNQLSTENDPFLSTLYIPYYDKIGQEVSVLTEQVGNFVKQSGIIFESGESGNLLYAK